MARRLGLILTVAALLPFGAGAQDKQEQDLGPKSEPSAMGSAYQPLYWRGDDAKFAIETWRANQCQIDAGQLAASQSHDSELQDLAERSVVLQTHINKQLRSMAKVIDFKLEEKKKHAETCRAASDLANLSGVELDRAYAAFLAKAAADNSARFTAESAAVPNSANFNLRKFAANKLPALDEVHKAAESAQAKLAPAKK